MFTYYLTSVARGWVNNTFSGTGITAVSISLLLSLNMYFISSKMFK